jgi:hypothetical protein
VWLVEKQYGTAKTGYLARSQAIHQQYLKVMGTSAKEERKKKVEGGIRKEWQTEAGTCKRYKSHEVKGKKCVDTLENE